MDISFGKIITFSGSKFDKYGDRIYITDTLGRSDLGMGLIHYNTETGEHRVSDSIGRTAVTGSKALRSTLSQYGKIFETRKEALDLMASQFLDPRLSDSQKELIYDGCSTGAGEGIEKCFMSSKAFYNSRNNSAHQIERDQKLAHTICVELKTPDSTKEPTECIETVYLNSKHADLINQKNICEKKIFNQLNAKKSFGRFVRKLLTPSSIRPVDWMWDEHLQCLLKFDLKN